MAEAFVHRGRQVTVVEKAPEVMPTLDPDMGALMTAAMRRHGVEVRCDTALEGVGDHVVRTSAGDLPADLVILGLGVTPNAELAGEAGIELGVKGAVRVDRRQRTSAPAVWAAGDCCTSRHLVSGKEVHIALGTVANKQSRVAGIDIGGGVAGFPGVLGTAISKVCDTEVARTGLTERQAEQDGFAACAVTIESTTRAGYFPGGGSMCVKLVVERVTGRLLGAQIVGAPGAAKRIDVCAVALTTGLRVDEMVHLDLAYAPPFSGVWDPILVAAREALKVL
jgi:NADPH-dependent 2,4-dienoyl-CoA reductase/sulfur reductase-like enzyme